MHRNMFNRLPDNYSREGQVNNEKFHQIIYGELAEIKQVFKDIKDYQNLDRAIGKTLDNIGKNVLELRATEDDNIYRQYIKTKIIANLSKGDIDTINYVSDFLLKDEFLGFEETWKNEGYDDVAGLVGKIKLSLSSIPYILDRVKAGGVKLYWEATAVDNLVKVKSHKYLGKSNYPLCNEWYAGTWWYHQNVGKVKASIVNIISKIKDVGFEYPETALISASTILYQEHQFAKQKTFLRDVVRRIESKKREFDYIRTNEILSGTHPYIIDDGKLITEVITLKQKLGVGDVEYSETAMVVTSEEMNVLYEFAKQLAIQKVLEVKNKINLADIDYKYVDEIIAGEYPELLNMMKEILKTRKIKDEAKSVSIAYPLCNETFPGGED